MKTEQKVEPIEEIVYKAEASFINIQKFLQNDKEIEYAHGVQEFLRREDLENETNTFYEDSIFFVAPKTPTIRKRELEAITKKLGQRISNNLSCEMVTLPPTAGSSKDKTDIRVGGLLSQNEPLRQTCVLVFPDRLSAAVGALKYKTEGRKSDYGILSAEQIQQYKSRNNVA